MDFRGSCCNTQGINATARIHEGNETRGLKLIGMTNTPREEKKIYINIYNEAERKKVHVHVLTNGNQRFRCRRVKDALTA